MTARLFSSSKVELMIPEGSKSALYGMAVRTSENKKIPPCNFKILNLSPPHFCRFCSLFYFAQCLGGSLEIAYLSTLASAPIPACYPISQSLPPFLQPSPYISPLTGISLDKYNNCDLEKLNQLNHGTVPNILQEYSLN